MKSLFNQVVLLILFSIVLGACKKDMDQHKIVVPTSRQQGFKSSVSTLVLSAATDASKVVTFSFKAPDYGVKVVPTYTLQFDLPSDTSGANAWGNAVEVKLAADSLQKTFLGADFNSILFVQLKLETGVNSTIAVRLKSEVNQNTGGTSSIKPIYSTLTMTVNPYRSTVVYPALLVKGGNSWRTPDTRTNGLLLASSKFNGKYEGYLDLPNADGYGGDAFQLVSTADAKVYGWGTNGNTLSIGGGNLWLSPAPAYMKVNADLDALTITYTPVRFFISGEDNGWNVSSTPMTYDPVSKTWIATNVSLTAGKTFAFTSNGSYDISYKLDDKGNLVFAGKDVWGGFNIPVSKTGVFTVTLDMSAGDGNYTYSVK